MFSQIVKRLSIMIAVVLCLQLGFSGTAGSAVESPVGVKELNFVFLHGAIGNPCGPQMLNPGIKISVNAMNRCYPSDVDAETWANNIADSIDKYLPGKGNLILIGHSMGGKSALYAVAKNVGDLADRTALVVTINSPIKSLDRYSVAVASG